MIATGVAVGSLAPVGRAPAPIAAVAAEAKAADRPVETVIQRDSNGQFFAYAEVNGDMVRFVVDTGADMVALTLDDARRAGVKFDRESFVPIARSASGVAYGQAVVLDDVLLDGKRVRDVHGAVVDGLDVSLLGQSYLRHLASVHMQGDEMRLR